MTYLFGIERVFQNAALFAYVRARQFVVDIGKSAAVVRRPVDG